MGQQKEVPEKEYPPKVDYSSVAKGMVRVSVVDTAFHSLMAILLVTGLMIDLIGPWLGGWLLLIRSVVHGYLGSAFVIVFILYIARVAYSKKMRTVLTATNYMDFVFYAVLIITGVSRASANQPWIDIAPWLSEALSPIVVLAPAIHVATTYVWIVLSLLLPGGILHGLASVYLISHLKKRFKIERHE